MKIRNLELTSPFRAVGLTFEPLKDLKGVVALFGKNGAGKSRLLRNIQLYINERKNEYTVAKDNISKYINNNVISEASNEFLKLKNIIDNFNRDFEGENIEVIEIFPYSDGIEENEIPDSSYRQVLNDIIANPRFSEVKKNALNILKALCKSELARDFYKLYSNKLGQYKVHDDYVERNVEILNELKILIKEILDKEFSYTTDEHLNPIVSLNNWPLHRMDLSAGQQSLLAFCIFIALQAGKVKNQSVALSGKIILLDEPDIFLHPKAQIDFIEGLKRVVGPNGQIWIATHSLTILSILERDEIWLFDEGKITSPSISTPTSILNSLIGEYSLPRLQSFLSSQYEWAAIQFSIECLCDPKVVAHRENDPQAELSKLTVNGSLKILDFGAGQGRVGTEILKNRDIASNIFYQTLEINEKRHNKLKGISDELQSMSNIERHKERIVLTSDKDLKTQEYLNYYDRVLLTNVLHEIPLKEWENSLNAILYSLKESGKIILLEDQEIPHGERAHKHGFLILGVEEVKVLFNLKETPLSHVHPRYGDRLVCIEIQKNKASVTRDSILEALKLKKINCKIEIEKLALGPQSNVRNGRKNAFYTQLYCNVDRAIWDIENGLI